MKLKEFIDQKRKEFIESGLYRDVEFLSAEDVGLNKNSVLESFLPKKSDLEKECVEITDFSTLPEGHRDSNGSLVKFDLLPKGKRKYITKRFYLLYI